MPSPIAQCRLYLLVPPAPGPDMTDELLQALGAGDVACVLLGLDDAHPLDGDLATRLIQLCHARDVAVLIEDDTEKVSVYGADGVHLGPQYAQDLTAYTHARSLLGGEKTVGVHCGLSRHNAMTLGEAGADYVAFGAPGEPLVDQNIAAHEEELTSLLSWWSALVELPCVAWDVDRREAAKAFAAAGSDFLAAGSLVWEHGDGPAEGVRRLLSCFDEACRG